MDKAGTTESEVGKLKDPAATVVNQERADAFANIADDCYEYHKALIIKWEELQETMIESIESLNKIPAHTVVGRKAASLIDKWEGDLVKVEEKVQKVLDKIEKKYEKAVNDCDELGFRPNHTELYRMENAVEAEAKFLEAKQKLEKQGTDFVKKKIGSALISNKQVILEDFDGEPENWDAFYETFKPIVEENAELLDVVKFALLKKSCKGKAGDMIRMYNSADYFKEAVDRLKKVYDDKDNRFRMLWDRLENVRTARETVSSMRATINDVAAIVSALKKVNQVKQNQKNVTSQSESVTNLPFESPAEVNTSRSNESPPEVNESLGVPVEPGVINRTNQSPTNQQLMEELFYTRRRDFTHFLWSPGVS
ncbi:hypothetical protein B9Z55_004318 [Caenorhabditis nigoni]|uniref:Uncharacterized protein n=1 Tax=Caenorhabditis nigoni TaxID=1611254 RepID=A0A2G5UVT9_9PELO|nr:hypothetical protein B9Z55_004318 [Caenorhabditis nigoni]